MEAGGFVKMRDAKKPHYLVFTKILAGFLLVVFPLYLFCIQIYITGNNSIKNELAETSKAQAVNQLSSLERDMTNILTVQTGMLADMDLFYLRSRQSVQDNYEFYKAVNAVRNKLIAIQNVNSLISRVYVYFPWMDKIISTGLALDTVPDGERDFLLQSIQDNRYPFSSYGDCYYTLIAAPFARLVSGTYPDYVIAVQYSKSGLLNVVRNMARQGDDSGIALCSDGYGLEAIRPDEADTVARIRAELPDDGKAAGSPPQMVASGRTKYMVFAAKSASLQTTLVYYIPQQAFYQTMASHQTWFWMTTAATILLTVLFGIMANRTLHTPLLRLMKLFQVIETGNFNEQMEYRHNDEFGFIYSSANRMTTRLKRLVEEVYEQRVLLQQAEIKQLQYQINPHFLYNSLFVVSNLIRMEDVETAQKMTDHLSRFYQYITKGAIDDIPLDMEVQHVRDYMEIHMIRFSNRLSVSFGEIPAGMGSVIVPKLILQPILENSLKHGLGSMVRHARIDVWFESAPGRLSIFIQDNGVGTDVDQLSKDVANSPYNAIDSKGNGLANTNRRLKIKYAEDSGLFFSLNEEGGLRTEIRILLKDG